MQEIAPLSWVQSLFFRLCRFICWFYFKVGWRLKIRGTENIPKKGPAILASNHRSYADPPLVGVSVKRHVHFLAKEELFSFAPFGWLISALNAHPLKRSGGDIAALKAAKRILGNGELMIVFPEGRRNRSQTLAKPKAGAGMLARLADCPIIPVYIHNSAEMFQFKQLSVHFGKPIHPKESDTNQSLAEEVMRHIQQLKDTVNTRP